MNEPTPSSRRQEADPAAPGWRLVALVYDVLPLIPVVMAVSLLFLWLNDGETIERAPIMQFAASGTMWLAVGGYFVLSWRRGGQTMGMRPFRLRVVAADGSVARTRQLWARYTVATLTPVIGFAWAFFRRDRRTLYDLAADTAFVRLRPPTKKA